MKGSRSSMTSSESDRSLSLEEQIAILQKQLIEAQRMTSMGELVSTTTHEFNNVLMSIINYAKLGMRHKDEASRDRYLEKILKAGERAAKITNSVLGMARNRSNQMESTDLSVLINESLILLERELRKYRIDVELRLGDVPRVTANGNQIQQVLLNLLINARQAMVRGGRVFISLSHDPSSQTVDMAVRDTGGGIPADKLRRIFDPFFSTKSGPDETGKGGAGLGLSACRNIVESHRGRIRVESTVGRGTCFTIRLPVAAKASPPPRHSASGTPGKITPFP